MSSFSYQEKSWYAALAASLLIYVPYFVHVLRAPNPSWAAMSRTVIGLIVVLVLLEIIVAATTRQRVCDERDRRINAKGTRAAYLAMTLGIAGIFCLLGTQPAFPSIEIANALLGAIFFAYTVHLVTNIVLSRRSM